MQIITKLLTTSSPYFSSSSSLNASIQQCQPNHTLQLHSTSIPAMALPSRSITQQEIVDDVVIQKAVHLNLPLPLPPTQFKFLSYSLPNSAYSSPRFSTAVAKKQVHDSDSTLGGLQCGGQSLNRSKSCGEGRARAFPDNIDVWQQKHNSSTPVVTEKGHKHRHKERCWKTENGEREWRRCGGKMGGCGEVVRCGALCLLLRGFGKGKGGREREEEVEGGKDGSGCISRRISLEKFECGSWASSGSLYFDLPIELIRSSVGAQTQTQTQTQTPVQAAFVFDNYGKGIWAEESAGANANANAASCIIAPGSRKPRDIEEFNALILLELEAQSGY